MLTIVSRIAKDTPVGIFECTTCGHLISNHSPAGGMFYCAVCRTTRMMKKVG